MFSHLPAQPSEAESGFVTVASLLAMVTTQKRDEVRGRLAMLSRDELLRCFRSAKAQRQRAAAFFIAEALIAQGVPPCFWHESQPDGDTLYQRYELMLHDMMWLRSWYPEHASNVRYLRGKAMFRGSSSVFYREVDFAFYAGKRPAWKIVGSLSLTIRQQWDCVWLRSTPIKKQAVLTEMIRDKVYHALEADLALARRTTLFGTNEAAESLKRRYALWRCSRMVATKSPTEIAQRYEQMTGISITRQATAKYLAKIDLALRRATMTSPD